MSLRRISTPGNLRTQPEARRSDTDGFEQRAMGYLAAKSIQIIQAVLTGIEAMHYNVELVKNLKAPRLSVIPAWRPSRKSRTLSTTFGIYILLPTSACMVAKAIR